MGMGMGMIRIGIHIGAGDGTRLDSTHYGGKATGAATAAAAWASSARIGISAGVLDASRLEGCAKGQRQGPPYSSAEDAGAFGAT